MPSGGGPPEDRPVGIGAVLMLPRSGSSTGAGGGGVD